MTGRQRELHQRKVRHSMSRFSDPIGALRPATLSIVGLAIAAAAVVAVAANAGPAGAAPTASASASPTALASAVPPRPVTVPTPTSTPAPVISTPVPTPHPSHDPADGGHDAIPINLDLDTFDGHAVSLDIVDRTGSITSATSGRPGDGASVEAYTVEVVNVDDRTIRLTWIDYPIDNRLALFVDEVDGRLQLLLVQPEPRGDTDSIGFDRQVDLTFDHAVDASTVRAILQDGLDTPG
jgi:hypothetical protein